MKKKSITIEIPVDMLRKEAVAYMNGIFEADIHPDICPSDEELARRFDKNIQDPYFVIHLENIVLDLIFRDSEIFEDYYENDYIQELIEKSRVLDMKENVEHEAEKLKHLESAKMKLTPEEREALGLKS